MNVILYYAILELTYITSIILFNFYFHLNNKLDRNFISVIKDVYSAGINFIFIFCWWGLIAIKS